MEWRRVRILPEWITAFFKWYWENKEYTLPATLAFGADLYFKWHSIIFDIVKNRFLKRNFRKSNYTLYKEGLQRQRQQILQEPLYVWGYEDYENTTQLYEKCYIKKVPIINLGNAKKRNLLVRKNRGVAILGKAGAGKSTYLRHLFLSYTSHKYAILNIILNRRYYFYKVSELVKKPDILKYLENDRKNARVKFIFLDGLDEISDEDYKRVTQIIEEIFDYNYTIMLSCRKDIYEIIKRVEPQIFTLIRYHYEIGDWNLMQSNQYIMKYAEAHHGSDIINLIKPYQENGEYEDFFKTPLELSLLIYIVEKGQNNLAEENIIANRFDLYDKFLHIWLQREIIRKNDNEMGNELDLDEILDLYSTIAFLLIKSSNDKLVYTNNSEIKYLLKDNNRLKKYIDGIIKVDNRNNRKCIIGFSHERITEFLVAYYFYLHVSQCDEHSIEAILWEYKYTVTSFIQEKFCLLCHDDLERSFMNLTSILLNTDPYKKKSSLSRYKKPISAKLRKCISNLSNEDTRTIKNQIIYFISRISNIDSNLLNAGNQVIKEVYEREQDEYNKRSAAIGATILGNSEIELRYARELLDNEESNLRDRSFTMVYYQDVKGKNPFTYVDDGINEWDNSRKSRLERLSDNSEKSLRLRTFDLITIFNFTKSRINKFVPNEGELDIVRNCEVNISSYSDEKKELLNQVKQDLIQIWENLITG